MAYETWNGQGPNKLKREQVPMAVRLALLGDDMQLFQRLGGSEGPVEVAQRRADKAYDPALTAVFVRHAAEILEGLDDNVSWATVLELEPESRHILTETELDEALSAIAGFVDLKSPYLAGHSLAVSELAAAAAEHCRCSPAEVQAVRRAGLVHEIGLAGVSAGILGKTGALTESEAERLRMHTYYAERVLARPEPLAQLGTIAAMHHERLDGSGYHRGVPAGSQPLLARILAAACVYQTELSEQPGRPARTPGDAARRLEAEAAAGRLDPQAVSAVLAAAGQTVRLPRQSYPAGLSEREVDVLRLLSRGLSRKEIAQRLVIADKTVARHIENIYDKLGTNTRPAATLFAMQHGLLS
jgi:response regulator RpfG family c-di-GMP phosphodiesterase